MLSDPREAERAVVVACAPAALRPGFAALLALDRRLGDLVARNGNPLVAQMRLTWWHGALEALDGGEAPAEPILQAVAAELIPRGIAGAGLAAMIDGWDALLEPVLDEAALARHAAARGRGLFDAAAKLFGAQAEVGPVGEGWALAEVARRTDGDAAALARSMADPLLRSARALPGAARALTVMALLARLDLDGVAPGSPRRAWRLLRGRLTGR